MTSRRMSALYPHLIAWTFLIAGAGYFLYNLDTFITYGLDLVGGTYVTLKVQLERAQERELYNTVQDAVSQLKRADKPTPTQHSIEGARGTVRFATAEEANQAYSYLNTNVQLKDVTFSKSGDESIQFQLTEQAIERTNSHALEQNLEALRGRVRQIGAEEIPVVAYGNDKIIVELPHVKDLQYARSVIGRAAMLELKPVEDAAQTEDALLEKYAETVPAGYAIYTSQQEGGYFLLPKYAEMTGAHLKTARMQLGGATGTEPVVSITWDKEGQRLFHELTKEHTNERIAIVVDDQVISAPVVNAPIDAGEASISGGKGGLDRNYAQQLATLLQSGAFAAPVEFVEERHIGPELGSQAIRQGLIACGVSLALLLLFSLIVYKGAGVLAFVVLLANLVVILMMLSALNATLTLPGIAGMVLTVGMAIDASILIYERIKEELAEGQSLRKAVDEGFSGATAVILDANVTHLLISVVLYWLGSGPIQGFGVTMIVGIVATLLTGLWMLRYLFRVLTDVVGINKISI